MLRYFVVVSLIFWCIFLTAQPGQISISPGMKFTLNGSVVDANTQAPIEYANIVLYSHRDSTMVTGTITDENGQFYLEVPRPGRFFMSVQFIGYEKYTLTGLMINPQTPAITLKPISIAPSAILLQEAVVVDRRNEVIYKIDKKVIQVAGNPNAIGNTAVEVLENTPGFEVDDQGNVLLRGSENFTVLINGKPTVLRGNDALKQIPASSIESIEVITNPSARYDPDGLTGIINIVLKREDVKGLNGLIDLSAGNRDRYGASINLNYRYNQHSITLGYDFNQGYRGGVNFSDRKTFLSNDTISRIQNGRRDNRSFRNTFRLGYDLDFSPNTTMGINSMFQLGTTRGYNENLQNIISWLNQYTISQISKIYENEGGQNFDINSTLIHKFNNDGHEIQLMTTASGNLRDANQKNYIDPWQNSVREWFDTTKTDEKYYTSQVDYSLPLGTIKLETGARSRFRDIDFQRETFNNPYIPSQELNHFVYSDQIHALYLMGKSKIENWEFQLGLRTEYYRIETEQKSTGETALKEDINLFPTLHVSNSIGDNKVMVSYSRRITRPGIQYLNPYEEFNNDNVRKGNPYLDPEFSHSIEGNYLRYFGQSTASGTLFYRQTNNAISWVRKLYQPDLNNGVMLMTFENVRKQASLGIEVSLRHSFTPWFQFDGNYSFYYFSVEGENVGEPVSRTSLNHSVRTNLTFRPARNTTINVFAMYNSPSVTTQGKRGAFFNNGFSVRQQVLNRKGTLTLSLRNPIGKFRWEFQASGPGFEDYFYRQPYMPVITLGFSYRLNEGIKKRRTNGERSEEFSPEMEL